MSTTKMKIEKNLETVFLEEWNTTAFILETRIVVMLFNNKYMSRQECFEHIYEHCKGLVQTSEQFREAKRRRKEGHGDWKFYYDNGFDPLLPYEKLYDDLIVYASEKFKTEFRVGI